ncbi:hypothetical protein [Thauera sp. Sel9]|uniref:hypothetical protein n=1 Tax=Thauera sp. Sel9 TaxID=2974299 RepID=UPI0021E15240|nr:hypothetical protein [Thauera sp. Sel9]MCV2216543.1 hypothetical protein [Thauera sp. Sel9]
MKKLFIILGGIFISSSAFSADFGVGGGIIRDTDCALLSENVRINLSKDVVGGWACNSRAVSIAACHPTGRKTTRTLTREVCTGEGEDRNCENVTGPVTGSAIPFSSTDNGTVGNDYPGRDCVDAAVATDVATAQLPAAD